MSSSNFVVGRLLTVKIDITDNERRLGYSDIYYKEEVIKGTVYHRLKCESSRRLIRGDEFNSDVYATSPNIVKDKRRGSVKVCHRSLSDAARDLKQELGFELAARYDLPFKELFDRESPPAHPPFLSVSSHFRTVSEIALKTDGLTHSRQSSTASITMRSSYARLTPRVSTTLRLSLDDSRSGSATRRTKMRRTSYSSCSRSRSLGRTINGLRRGRR